jgi:hypothetical protein
MVRAFAADSTTTRLRPVPFVVLGGEGFRVVRDTAALLEVRAARVLPDFATASDALFAFARGAGADVEEGGACFAK